MLDKNMHFKQFEDYASNYDLSDGRIRLKMLHTREVCRVMERITFSMQLKQSTADLAWLCALYHDVARFEQITQYGTFIDAYSFDHGEAACQIIDKKGFLYDQEKDAVDMIKSAIRYHNKYEIGPTRDEETLLLCRLIRDADKCDIFRVFACEDMIDTMGETVDQVSEEKITDIVMESVLAHRCVVKEQRKTGLDKWIGFLGFIYDLNFSESIRIVKEEGYYRMPFDHTEFKCAETNRRVQMIMDDLEVYMKVMMESKQRYQ